MDFLNQNQFFEEKNDGHFLGALREIYPVLSSRGSAPSLFNAMFFLCKSECSSCFFRIAKDLNFRLHSRQHSFSVSINGPRDASPIGVPTAMGLLGRIGLLTIMGGVGVRGRGDTRVCVSGWLATGKLFVFFLEAATVGLGSNLSCFWK